MTKSAYFFPVKTTDPVRKLAKLYLKEIVKLQGVPISIVSDRGHRFTSMFWKELQIGLGARLKFSTASHPQTDGQSEQTIQSLEDTLRVCALDFPGSWAGKVALMEFAYNNSYHQSLEMPPFEALYGRKCRSPIHWHEAGERKFVGPEEVDRVSREIEIIKRILQASIDRQKKYIKNCRQPLEFEVRDKVFLKVSPMRGMMRFVKREKLSLWYVGPFEVIERSGVPIGPSASIVKASRCFPCVDSKEIFA